MHLLSSSSVKRQPLAIEHHRYRYAVADRFGAPTPCDDLDPASDAICPQPVSRLNAITGPPPDAHPQSEQCLTVSVAAPRPDGRLRPVVVFFHGGGFGSGSGVLSWYDGTALAAEGDLVVISASYRLGPFGYLVLDGVSDGNLGLLDQLEALEWVHRHAAELGGDPDSITVMGQSAGAMSIDAMIELRDPHRPLFRRAIMQSGPIALNRRSREDALVDGAAFNRHLDGDPRQAPPADLLAAAADTARDHAERVGNVADPAFALTRGALGLPSASVPAANLAGLDVLVGWNSDEWTAFGARGAQVASLTYSMFETPWAERTEDLRAAGARVNGYELTWRPVGSPFGATHCLELPLLLGDADSWRAAPMLGRASWDEVAAYGRGLRRVWAGFAHTGEIRPPDDLPVRWSVST